MFQRRLLFQLLETEVVVKIKDENDRLHPKAMQTDGNKCEKEENSDMRG